MEKFDLPEYLNEPDAMTFDEAMEALHESLQFGIEPSLEGMYALAEQLGRPQDTFKSVQIAGTNGKSSTVRLVAAILRAHGYKVGLYTSPELVYYPERMEVDGKVISDELFGRVIGDAVKAGRDLVRNVDANVTMGGVPVAIADGKPHAGVFTEFELLTAAALHLYALAKCDFAVLEVGMGGRWDATSIVEPEVAGVTGIGLDHTAILGDTIEEIAGEKAAIIKPGSKAVLGTGTAATTQVFLDQCRQSGTNPIVVREGFGNRAEYSPVDENHTVRFAARVRGGIVSDDIVGIYAKYPGIGMHAPSYQKANIAMAVAICEQALGRELDLAATRKAVGEAQVPGRFETLSRDPLLIIDAAHNPESAGVLATSIRERFDNTADGHFAKPTVLLGIFADKDYRGIIRALAPVTDRFVVSASHAARSLKPEELAAIVEEETGVRPDTYPTLEEALAALRDPRLNKGVRLPAVVATGSISVAGEVKGLQLDGKL